MGCGRHLGTPSSVTSELKPKLDAGHGSGVCWPDPRSSAGCPGPRRGWTALGRRLGPVLLPGWMSTPSCCCLSTSPNLTFSGSFQPRPQLHPQVGSFSLRSCSSREGAGRPLRWCCAGPSLDLTHLGRRSPQPWEGPICGRHRCSRLRETSSHPFQGLGAHLGVKDWNPRS